MSSKKITCTRIRKLFLLNLNDPRNFARYSSVKAMKSDQMNQMKYNAFRIHPHSRFRICWETFYIGYMVINVAFNYIFLIIITLSDWTTLEDVTELSIGDLPILINIIVNLITGVFYQDQDEVNFKLRKIFYHNLNKFICDLFGLVVGSCNMLILFSAIPFLLSYFELFLSVISISVLLRLHAPWLYWSQSVSRYFMLDGLVTGLIQVTVFFFVFSLFLATIGFIIIHSIKYRSHTAMNMMFNTYFGVFLKVWSKTSLFEHEKNALFLIFDSCVVIFPYIQFFTTTCILVLLFWSKSGASHRYNSLIDNLNAYLQQVNISDRLKFRIVQFYKETYKGKYYSEIDILRGLSSELKEDILSKKISTLRQEITILGMIPLEELLLVAQNLVSEVYFANDVIGYSGTPHDRMYFIARGTVAVYTDEATEFYHISNSNLFLSACLNIEHYSLLCNYMACETSTLYSLSRIDYATIRDEVPIFNELIMYMAELFVETHKYVIEKETGESRM